MTDESHNEFFEDLKAGLQAAIEHASGKRADLRTTTLPRPPKRSNQNAPGKLSFLKSAEPTMYL